MTNTSINIPINDRYLTGYFSGLVNSFFKILPIREQDGIAPTVYMKSLQTEIIGCESFIPDITGDAYIVTLLSILQYLINYPDTPVKDVKREVFKAISLCNKLKNKYGEVLEP